MSRMKDRSTADLIVIALTFVVCFTILVSMVGLILLEIYRPEVNIDKLATRVGTLVSSLVGAIIGYLAGRNVTDDRQR
jgi:hypothetical protein